MSTSTLTNDFQQSAVDPEHPWPGLSAFTEDLHQYFHGRDREVDDLFRCVRRKLLTVLFGQSGLGKTSLLQAGLFPRLRRESLLPVPIRLDYAAGAPELAAQVKAAIARALEATGLAEALRPEPTETLWEYFHHADSRLEDRDGKPISLVLVLDQFEELFTLGSAGQESRSRTAPFHEELADLIENRAPATLEEQFEGEPGLVERFIFDRQDYRVLICLREDYLPHLEVLRGRMPSIGQNRMRLTRMSGLQAFEAVIKAGNGLVSLPVCREIVRFVAGSPGKEAASGNGRPEEEDLAGLEVEPSLLSLVCRELNNRRLEQQLPEITADLLAGSSARILHDFYGRCLADQLPAVRAFVEDELLTDSGFRENIALEKARKMLAQCGAPASAIDELVKRRLLHVEERLEIQRVELAHDVLTPVIQRSRDERQQREAMLRAEQQAQEARAKARRQRKRQRLIVSGMAFALIVVSGFGLFSYHLYLEAKQAREAAEESQKLADRNFELARRSVDKFMTQMSQEGRKGLLGLQDLCVRFAQEAVDSYEVYVADRPDDPDVIEGQGRSLTALGALTGQVGSFDKAVSTLENAIRIHQVLVVRYPTELHRFQLAEARFELGYLYWSVQNENRARPYLEQAVEELEELNGQRETRREVRIALARAWDRLGSVLYTDSMKDRRKGLYERSLAIFQELCNQHPDADSLFGLSIAYHRMYENETDEVKSLQRLDQALETLRKARAVSPSAPEILHYRGIYFMDKATQLTRLKQLDDALKCSEEAVMSLRSAVKENPLVNRYQLRLSESLSDLASRRSGLGRYAESRSLYEEARDILERLTQQNNDRPMYGTALIKTWLELATFHLGGKGDEPDEVTQPQSQLYCLNQALENGRKLCRKFPDDMNLHYQFAVALFDRAQYDSGAGRNKEAYPFFQEGVETFRAKVCGGRDKPIDYQLGRFLVSAELAQECAYQLKRGDEVIRLARLVYELGKDCSDREGIRSLGRIIHRSGGIHENAGRYQEAIEAYSHALDIFKPGLEKAPWNWWVRQDVAAECKDIAQCYERIRDFRNEVLTWREYLKVWSGPMDGMKIDDYIDAARPTDEPEAVRLRQFVKSSPGLKRIEISADFNGLTYPFQVYLTNVPWPKDPLEDQARWLSEERGGTIPEEVRETFRTLQKTAHQNNINFQELGALHEIATTNKVSFPDLCTYALGKHFKETWMTEELAHNKSQFSERFQTLERLHKIAEENKVDFRDLCTYALEKTFKLSRVDPEALASSKTKLQAEVAALTERAKKESENAGVQLALAQALERLGTAHVSLDETKQAIQSFERSRQIYELLFWKRADSAAVFEGLGNVCSKLGALSNGSDVKEIEKAYALYQRSVDAFDQLSFRQDAGKEWQKQEAQSLRRLGSLCSRISSSADGVRWYVKAMALNDQEAAEELAAVYREHPELPKAFPAATRKLLELLGGPTKKDLLTLPHLAHIEALFQFAEWYEKGINVKPDPKKAEHCRYLGCYARGRRSFLEKLYQDGLPDLKRASESKEADSDDHNRLGMCYAKLGRWDEAITACTRSVELDIKSDDATSHILNLLQALISAERPERLFQFVESVEKKGWKLPKEGTDAAKYNAFFHAFRAVALRMTGQDATQAERMLHAITRKPGYKTTGWNWEELDAWLKKTKLAPDRKEAVDSIIADLKGTTTR